MKFKDVSITIKITRDRAISRDVTVLWENMRSTACERCKMFTQLTRKA